MWEHLAPAQPASRGSKPSVAHLSLHLESGDSETRPRLPLSQWGGLSYVSASAQHIVGSPLCPVRCCSAEGQRVFFHDPPCHYGLRAEL